MKILYILTASFPPSSNVGALRPFRLAKRIAQEGWKVVIISKIPNVNFAHNTSLLHELGKEVEIHYLSKKDIFYPAVTEDIDSLLNNIKKESMSGQKNKFIKRLAGFTREQLTRITIPDLDIFTVPFMVKKAVPLLKKSEDAVILTTSPPHSLHLAGFICKKLTKLPWVADFRDPWDRYPVTGSIYLRNPIERKLKRTVIESANAVISTTNIYNLNLTNEFRQLNKNKFTKITNSYDAERIELEKSSPKDKFVISYTGIFYPNKDPFTFFRALRTWFDGMNSQDKRKFEEALTVQLIGSRTKIVEQTIDKLELWPVVKFINRVPHEEALRMSISSDLLLICAGLGKETRPGWIPSKLLEYLGCRVPILAICREGEMAEIIRKTESGYVITKEDHNTICTILKKEIDNKLVGNAHSGFKFINIEQFEEKYTMQHFVQVIERIASCHRSEEVPRV